MASKMHRRHDWHSLTVWVVLASILAGCQAPTAQPAPTSEPAIPTAPPPATSTPSAALPFAGIWTGHARNGTFDMHALITIRPDCQLGAVCGTVDLATIPCSGTYKWIG